VAFKFFDNYGVRTELMFSQKGGRYRYDGESTHVFNTTSSGNKVVGVGTSVITSRITNNYLEIPITGYAKVGSKLEFQLGASVAFLVSSTSVGDWRFTGISDRDNSPIEFLMNFDYNYIKDDVLTTADLALLNPETTMLIPADGETIVIPNEAIAAYFDYDQRDGRFFRTVDLNLNAGASFYLSRGLFMGVTLNYGLLDASNNVYDFSRASSNGTDRIPRTDRDNNVTISGSVGFSF